MNGNSLASRHYKNIIAFCDVEKYVNWYYEAYIQTEKGEIGIDKVLTIDITKDYEKGFTDNMVLEVSMFKKAYIESLYPIKDNFKIILKQTQVTEKENGMRILQPKIEKRLYKGILVDPIDYGNNSKQSNTAFSNDDKKNWDKELINVKIQLYDLAAEQVMKMTFGQIVHGIPGEICRDMLTKAYEYVEVDKSLKIKGVSLITPDNQKRYDDIIIPHGTKLIDLPRYIQDKWYGIYNYGIGSYLHKGIWYLYPLYNYKRFDQEEIRATIHVIPKGFLMDSKRTYHVNRGHVTILCGGGVESKDNSNVKTINQGDGMTYYDKTKLSNEIIEKKESGLYLNAGKAKKQIVQSKRDDQMNYAPTVPDRVSTSLAQVMSQVSQRNGVAMTFAWEYGHPLLLVPGMPVRIVYYKDDKRYEVDGVLLHQMSTTQLAGNLAQKRHNTTVVMVVMVDQASLKQKEQKKYSQASKGVKSSALGRILSLFK